MAKAMTGVAVLRDWRLTTLIGGVCFALSFALRRSVLPANAVMAVPEPWASLLAAGLLALMAIAATLVLQTQWLRVQDRRMWVALNNMSQGLCMFDCKERLVVCNTRYMEMYNLPPEVARPGVTLTGLLEYRSRSGSFAPNIAAYRRELLTRWRRASRAVRKSNPTTATPSW